MKVKVLVTQSCLTLCDPMSPPVSSVHGIFQARILEWVAILFSRGSSQTRDQTLASCIAGKFFTVWATLEELMLKLKLQQFGHLMWRANYWEENPDAGKDWRQKEKGAGEDEMVR